MRAAEIQKGKRAPMHVGTMVQVNSTGMLFARLRTRLLLPLVAAALLGTVASASPQQLADPRVADLVQTGKVRVGLGLGTAALAIKDVATGELRGPAVDLARELAARIEPSHDAHANHLALDACESFVFFCARSFQW